MYSRRWAGLFCNFGLGDKMKTQLECFRLLEAGEKLTHHDIHGRDEYIYKNSLDIIVNQDGRNYIIAFYSPENWSIWKPPVEKWQVPEGWMYYVGGDGFTSCSTPVNLVNHRKAGATRPTKEHAERAAKRIAAGNILEAWLVAHAPDYVWKEGDEYWMICYDPLIAKYCVIYQPCVFCYTDIKFPSEELCQQARDALNSGKLSLEVNDE